MPVRAVRCRIRRVLVAAWVFVASQSFLAGAARADDLFLPTAPAGRQAPGTAAAATESTPLEFLGATLRSRQARIDRGLLAEARAAAERGIAPAGLIDLNLFDDVSFRIVDLRVAPTSSGYSLSGRFEGAPFGTVTLVVNGDVVVGTARMLGATYTIHSNGDDIEIRQADEHSGVNQQIRLAHVAELDYVETSTSFELKPLRLSEAGLMDSVHAMRDAVGADVVHLVERWGVRGRGAYCGVAYLMEEVEDSFARLAFGITVLGCGSAVFAHELDHNVGLNHDRYVTDVDLRYGLTNKPFAYIRRLSL